MRFPQTRKGEEQAAALRARVYAEVDAGTFDYAKVFPRSKQAKRYAKCPANHITVVDALKTYLLRKERHLAYSTLRDYEQRIYRHLIPAFGHLALSQLSASLVREWYQDLPLSGKAINNILIPLRDICREAYQDEILERDSLARIRALPHRSREPEPFSRAEVRKLLRELQHRSVMARCYFQFAFGSGLRTSELLALQWQDIDLSKNTVFVCQAKVREKLKGTKTSAGRRSVSLTRLATSALARLAQHSNVDTVFRNPIDGKPLKNAQLLTRKYWYPAIESLSIRRRNPYQTRHTYASHLLMSGADPMYVAQQMGHRDWGMIRKTYGKYIPSGQYSEKY